MIQVYDFAQAMGLCTGPVQSHFLDGGLARKRAG